MKHTDENICTFSVSGHFALRFTSPLRANLLDFTHNIPFKCGLKFVIVPLRSELNILPDTPNK